MSMGHKGALCAYCCAAEAQTADHVIARAFFPVDARAILPKVGACNQCNNKKSRLEHTLTSVMPFGARHERAKDALVAVESKLAKNQKLHRHLAAGLRTVFRSIDGSPWRPEMTIPFDVCDLEQLGEYIVKGLARHHWGLSLGSDTFVRTTFLRADVATAFDRFFAGKARNRVESQLGGGVFSYEGIQSVESGDLTLWRMSFYGAELGGDPNAPAQRVSIIYGISVAKTAGAAERVAAILGKPVTIE